MTDRVRREVSPLTKEGRKHVPWFRMNKRREEVETVCRYQRDRLRNDDGLESVHVAASDYINHRTISTKVLLLSSLMQAEYVIRFFGVLLVLCPLTCRNPTTLPKYAAQRGRPSMQRTRVSYRQTRQRHESSMSKSLTLCCTIRTEQLRLCTSILSPGTKLVS